MFPWADTVARRYPPIVVWSVIGISALAFLYQVGLPPRVLDRFPFDFALVPSRVFGQLRLVAPSDWTPFLTNIFLHAGWLHLILNMWTLWIFGPAVEDRLGPGRFTQGRVVRAMQDDGAPVRGGGALARTPCPPGQARHRGRTADCRPLRDPRHSHHDPVQERQGNREDERCNACRADSAVGAVARLEFTGIGLTCAMPSGEEGQEHAWRDRIY